MDILVDLAGHTRGNALPVLAYKPAPVEVSGIGYFASTGLSAVDYFLGDVYLDDAAEQAAFTEKLLILPHSHFCYTPRGDEPEPAAPPCQKNGCVTFGSFNNFTKVTDEVLSVWGEILRRVPESACCSRRKCLAARTASLTPGSGCAGWVSPWRERSFGL